MHSYKNFSLRIITNIIHKQRERYMQFYFLAHTNVPSQTHHHHQWQLNGHQVVGHSKVNVY